MTLNKYGLARTIPADIKRIVRQECGNGCVICGLLPYQYDHFDPPFEDAETHRPEGIALLCPNHHMDKTAGRLSPDSVKRARTHPYNINRPAIWHPHITEEVIALNIAGNVLQGTRVGLSINGSVVFGIAAPAMEGGQWLFTGSMCDPVGHETLRFVDNEIIAINGTWDVTLEGSTLTVRSGPRNIVALVSFRLILARLLVRAAQQDL